MWGSTRGVCVCVCACVCVQVTTPSETFKGAINVEGALNKELEKVGAQ